MPVLFWTDALFFVLIAVAAAFALYAAHHEHLRVPWRQVSRNKLGMGAAVVLSWFVVVGVLDSMHFRPRVDNPAGGPRYSGEIVSILDVVLAPIASRVEKTYSAPFATRLYAKETIELPDGSQVRDYPPLRFGGSHLQSSEQRWGDIGKTSAAALLKGLSTWAAVAVLLAWWLARRGGRSLAVQLTGMLLGRTALPWHVVLGTAGVLVVLTFLVADLAMDYHIFGTDKVGQDVFVQAVKSVRTGLMIGTLTTLIMLPFAIFMGITAGYFRGWVDDGIQYLYTTLSSIPGVLLIAAAILMLQVYMANHAEEFTSLAARADTRLLFLCMILGVTSWTGLCRLLRGEALKLREIDYVQAASAFGVSHFRILMRHLLPNVMHIVTITVVLDFSGLVLAEAVLSYINIGVDPSMQSWGNMINSARLEMAREPIVWWSLAAAFVFMFGLVLSANLFSDAVRDAFDPRLRELRA